MSLALFEGYSTAASRNTTVDVHVVAVACEEDFDQLIRRSDLEFLKKGWWAVLVIDPTCDKCEAAVKHGKARHAVSVGIPPVLTVLTIGDDSSLSFKARSAVFEPIGNEFIKRHMGNAAYSAPLPTAFLMLDGSAVAHRDATSGYPVESM